MAITLRHILIALYLLSISTTSIAALTYTLCIDVDNKGYCRLDAHLHPSKPAKKLVHCGNTAVWLTADEQETLNGYLYANRNMVLKYRVGEEYIDSPCF